MYLLCVQPTQTRVKGKRILKVGFWCRIAGKQVPDSNASAETDGSTDISGSDAVNSRVR